MAYFTHNELSEGGYTEALIPGSPVSVALTHLDEENTGQKLSLFSYWRFIQSTYFKADVWTVTGTSSKHRSLSKWQKIS